MDFNTISETYILNPYGYKTSDGTWHEGYMSTEFLNNNFGQYKTATEMKNATTSEGLKLFFDYLVERGSIQA